MSPGSSVISFERYATSAGTEWTRSAVDALLHAPRRSARSSISIASCGPASSGVTSAGPQGADAVEDLARHPLRRLELVVARREVVQQRVAGHVVERVVLGARPCSGRRSRTPPRPRSRPCGSRPAAARRARRRQRVGELGEEGRRLGRLGALLLARASGSSGRCRRSCPAGRRAAAASTVLERQPSRVDGLDPSRARRASSSASRRDRSTGVARRAVACPTRRAGRPRAG